MQNLRLLKTSPTIKTALIKYINEISIRKKSLEQECSLVRIWSKTSIYNKPVGLVKPSELARIRDEWLLRLSPATVARRFALLSNLYTVMKKDWMWSYIKENPVQAIRKPSYNNSRDRRINTNISIPNLNSNECPKNELDWIIKSTKSKILPTILILAVETAMRRSEILNIKREHINFEHGTVYLPETKNGDTRIVPLTPLSRYYLINYISKYNPKNKIFNIVPSTVTGGFHYACLKARKHYEKLCRENFVNPDNNLFMDLRFHDLRHEATSRLASVYEMHELAKITGHKDTRMLLRYYHPDVQKLSDKFTQSKIGQEQYNIINKLMLELI